MILKPCPFCQKDIPRSITVCPYCHRDEQGKTVQIDSAVPAAQEDQYFEDDLKSLASEDPFVREQAVVRVAQRGFNIAQALISVLADLNKPGLAATAKVLGRIRDRRAIPALVQALKMGDDDLRTAAIWSLGQFQEPQVLTAFTHDIERQHPTLQGYMAFVLGSFHDSKATPTLVKLLRHPSREVAFQAACALGELGDQHALPALQRALGRKDPLLRTAAAAAIRRLGGTPRPPQLQWVVTILTVLIGVGMTVFLYLRWAP